ncbi:uncharacterized protein [Branchiostoma lanceolatum]|uniref:uncharacterized protein n=1 Tax=Branchiostoma lanceolatum TaxID=7740 RepID=UPI003453904A
MVRSATLLVAFALLASTAHAQFNFDDLDLDGTSDPFIIIPRTTPAPVANPFVVSALRQISSLQKTLDDPNNFFATYIADELLANQGISVDDLTRGIITAWSAALAAEENNYDALALQFESLATTLGFNAAAAATQAIGDLSEWINLTNILRALSARLQDYSPDSLRGVAWEISTLLASYGYPNDNASMEGIYNWTVALAAAGNNTDTVAFEFYGVAAAIGLSAEAAATALRDQLTVALDEGEQVYIYLMQVKQVLNNFNFTYVRQFSILIAQELSTLGFPITPESSETIYMWTAGLYQDTDGDIGVYVNQFYEVAATVNKTALELAEIVWRDLTAQMQGSAAVTAHLIEVRNLLRLVEFSYVRGLSEFIAYQLQPLGYPWQNDTLETMYDWTLGMYGDNDITPYIQQFYDVAALVNVSAADLSLGLKDALTEQLTGGMSVVTDLIEVKRLLKTSDFQYIDDLSLLITGALVPYGLDYNNESIASIYNWTAGLYLSDDIQPFVEDFYQVAYMLNVSATDLAAGLRQLLTDHFAEVNQVVMDLVEVKRLLNSVEFRYVFGLSQIITASLGQYGLEYNNESEASVYQWTADLYNAQDDIGPQIEEFYQVAYSLNVSVSYLSGGLRQLLTDHFAEGNQVVADLIEVKRLLNTVEFRYVFGLSQIITASLGQYGLEYTNESEAFVYQWTADLYNAQDDIGPQVEEFYQVAYSLNLSVSYLSRGLRQVLTDHFAEVNQVVMDLLEVKRLLNTVEFKYVEDLSLLITANLVPYGLDYNNETVASIYAWTTALYYERYDIGPQVEQFYDVAYMLNVSVTDLSAALKQLMTEHFDKVNAVVDNLLQVQALLLTVTEDLLPDFGQYVAGQLDPLGLPYSDDSVAQLTQWLSDIRNGLDFGAYVRQFYEVAAIVGVPEVDLSATLLSGLRGEINLGQAVYYDLFESNEILQKLDDMEVANVIMAINGIITGRGVMVTPELEQGIRNWTIALAKPGADLAPLVRELYEVAALTNIPVRDLSGSLIDHLRREYYTTPEYIQVVALILQEYVNVAYLKNVSVEITEILTGLGIPVPAPDLQMTLLDWLQNIVNKPEDLPLYIDQFRDVAALVNVDVDELAYGLLTEVETLAEAFPVGFSPSVQNILDNLPALMELIANNFPDFYANVNAQFQQFGMQAWTNITATLTNYVNNAPTDQAMMFQNKLPEIAALLGIDIPANVLMGDANAIIQYVQSQLPDMYILQSAIQQAMAAMTQQFPAQVVGELLELLFGVDIPDDFSFDPTYIVQQIPVFLGSLGIQVPTNYYEIVMAFASFEQTPEWFANNGPAVVSAFGISLPDDFQPTEEYVAANMDMIIQTIANQAPQIVEMVFNTTQQIFMQIQQNIYVSTGGDVGVFIQQVIQKVLEFMPGASDYFGFYLPADYRPELIYFAEWGIKELFNLIPTKDEFIAMSVQPIAATLAPNDTWVAELLEDQFALIYDLNMVYIENIPNALKWIGRWLGFELPDDFKLEPEWFISQLPMVEMFVQQNAAMWFDQAMMMFAQWSEMANMWMSQWMTDSQSWNDMANAWINDLPGTVAGLFNIDFDGIAMLFDPATAPDWMTMTVPPVQFEYFLTDGCVHAIAFILDIDIPKDYKVDDLNKHFMLMINKLFMMPADYELSFLNELMWQWKTFVVKPLKLDIPDDFRPSLQYLPDVMMYFGINPPDNFEPTFDFFMMRITKLMKSVGFVFPERDMMAPSRDRAVDAMPAQAGDVMPAQAGDAMPAQTGDAMSSDDMMAMDFALVEYMAEFFLLNQNNWPMIIKESEMKFAEIAAMWAEAGEKIVTTMYRDVELIFSAYTDYNTKVTYNFMNLYEMVSEHMQERAQVLVKKMVMYVSHMMKLGRHNFRAMMRQLRLRLSVELHYLAHLAEEFMNNNNNYPILQAIVQQFQQPTHPMMNMLSGFLDNWFQSQNKHPVAALHDYLHSRPSWSTSRPMIDVISNYLDGMSNRPSRPIIQQIMNYFNGQQQQSAWDDVTDFFFGMNDNSQRPLLQQLSDNLFGGNPTLQAISENFFGNSPQPTLQVLIQQMFGTSRPTPSQVMQQAVQVMFGTQQQGWNTNTFYDDDKQDPMSWLLGDDWMNWFMPEEEEEDDSWFSWLFEEDDKEDDKEDDWFSWMYEDKPSEEDKEDSWLSWLFGEEDTKPSEEDVQQDWWSSWWGMNEEDKEEPEEMWYTWFFTPPMEQDKEPSEDMGNNWMSWMQPQHGDQPDTFLTWLLSDNSEMYSGFDHLVKPMQAIRGRQWG